VSEPNWPAVERVLATLKENRPYRWRCASATGAEIKSALSAPIGGYGIVPLTGAGGMRVY